MSRRARPAADPLLPALAAAGIPATDAALRRHALAHDASHYLLTPRVVVSPRDADEVAAVLDLARRHGRHLVFRSGGTSLSGQAVADDLLVDTRTHFRSSVVLDGGARLRVEPGVTVRHANARLARHRRRLGPDPASELACTIGGVVANNSSGMACGTEQNAYRTLESVVVVLPSGTVVDTSAPDAEESLAAREPALVAGLLELRARVLADPESVARIRRAFAMKNTMGYALNALLDFESPVRILEHLLVGSEGTLGFVASATFRTVPVLPHATTGLAVFPDLAAATGALPAIVASGAATIELLDATSLRVAQGLSDVPPAIAEIAVDRHAALLVEYQADDAGALAAAAAAADALFAGLAVTHPVRFSADPAHRAALWHVRKGLFASVSGSRPSGTTALLEDIVVPVPALREVCEELAVLFDRHGYEDAVVFGHAKDGNIHFMLVERFDEPAHLERYRRFTEDLVDLVLSHGGNLKAEHGTGRVMAPFVRRQYGDELFAVSRRIKELFDPDGLLAPGAVLTEQADSYLRDLKQPATVEAEVDRCVECGYCEPGCPSRDLTLTPRQRIVVRRELAAAEARGDAALARELRDDYDYAGIQTCAVDGLCGAACPVGIDTGDLTRRLRAEGQGRVTEAVWATGAGAWGALTRGIGAALTVGGALPEPVVAAATTVGRTVLGADTVPAWSGELPGGGPVRRPRTADDPVAIVFPSCTGTMFGPADAADGRTGRGATAALLALADRAGVPVAVPAGIASACCGTPWKSKGLADGYRSMRERTLGMLRAATDDGRLPVVCDASSCSEGLVHLLAGSGITVVDAVTWAAEHLLPRLDVHRRVGSLALHPTCSSTLAGGDGALRAIGAAIADDPVVPEAWGCCAFAGDRGLLHPELTAAATAPEAAEIAAREFDAYASVNRTCELGMTRATGRPYRHLLELLDEATTP